MTRAQKLSVWGVAALLLAAGLAWFFSQYTPVERVETLPPTGEAAYNPLYALRQILRAENQPAQSRQHLQLDTVPLAKHDTVVIYSDPRTLTPQELRGLFAFAAGGGHLVLRLPAWDAPGKDKTHGNAALAEWLPLDPALLGPGCAHLQLPGQPEHVEFCDGPRFMLRKGARPLESWRNGRNAYIYGRFAHGAGTVDVLADMAMLRNDSLRERTHTVFVRQVLAPNWGRGTVHLVYAANMPPLWRWLLQRGWRAVLPAALALLAWLWLRGQRFGPWQPAPQQPRRALMEHVEASGEHLLRYGQLGRLHAALREAVLARLRRRDPLTAAQAGDTRAQLLAQRTGLPATQLRDTLDSRPPLHLAEFRQRISRLIDLRNRL
jgi:hypothetical protein